MSPGEGCALGSTWFAQHLCLGKYAPGRAGLLVGTSAHKACQQPSPVVTSHKPRPGLKSPTVFLFAFLECQLVSVQLLESHSV